MRIDLAVLQIDYPGLVEDIDDKIDIKFLNYYFFRELEHLPELLCNEDEPLQSYGVVYLAEIDGVGPFVREGNGGGEFVGLGETGGA